MRDEDFYGSFQIFRGKDAGEAEWEGGGHVREEDVG